MKEYIFDSGAQNKIGPLSTRIRVFPSFPQYWFSLISRLRFDRTSVWPPVGRIAKDIYKTIMPALRATRGHTILFA